MGIGSVLGSVRGDEVGGDGSGGPSEKDHILRSVVEVPW